MGSRRHVTVDSRICDLGLRISGPPFGALKRSLERELSSRGIRLRPSFYLSNEYGCVAGTANVGVLWEDALPQRPSLHKRFRARLRDPEILPRIMRHEAGHAFCYVHRLHARRDFRDLFKVRGDFFGSYPDGGWAPGAKDEARLRRGAHINIRCLKHPDEDFAICFQTWLHPEADWRVQYAAFPAILRKLDYVDRVARTCGAKPYESDPRDIDAPVESLTMTVSEWFGNRR